MSTDTSRVEGAQTLALRLRALADRIPDADGVMVSVADLHAAADLVLGSRTEPRAEQCDAEWPPEWMRGPGDGFAVCQHRVHRQGLHQLPNGSRFSTDDGGRDWEDGLTTNLLLPDGVVCDGPAMSRAQSGWAHQDDDEPVSAAKSPAAFQRCLAEAVRWAMEGAHIRDFERPEPEDGETP